MTASEALSRNPSAIVSGSGASGTSWISGSSGASGASGNPGNNKYTPDGHGGYIENLGFVEDLNITDIMDLFTKGNLTVNEMDKWIESRRYSVKNLSKGKDGNGIIKYEFTYGGKQYCLSCTEKAAASQTDKEVQKTFNARTLDGFDAKTISKYCFVAESHGNITMYALRPGITDNNGNAITNVVDLKKFLKAEEAQEAAEKAAQEAAANKSSNGLEKFMSRLEGNEFDKYVSKSGALEVINEMTALFKADLKEKYGFSDAFLGAVVDFAVSELDLQGGENYNLKEVLNKINDIINQITQADLHLELDSMYNNSLDDAKSTIAAFSNLAWRDENAQNKFLSYILKNMFKTIDPSDNIITGFGCNNSLGNQNYSLPCTRDIIYTEILENIANNLSIPVDELTMNKIMNIGSDNAALFFDEMFKLINNETTKYKSVDKWSSNKIDADIFMQGQESINGTYLADNFSKMYLSDDAGTRQFVYSIDQLLKSKLNIGHSYYNCISLFNAVIQVLNNEAGVTNTNPPTLSKSTIEKLNNSSKDIFSIIKNNLTQIENLYYTGSINGEIEGFGQGGFGDCWLLSGIEALKTSEVGCSILKDAIKNNGDGTFTVTLSGVGKVYEFTLDDIRNAERSRYVTGDNDVLLLELAIEKLHQEVILGEFELPEETITDTSLGDELSSGEEAWLIYYLTGITNHNTFINGNMYDNLNNIYNDFVQGNTVLTCNLKVDNIEIGDYALRKGHVYAIIGMEIKNPENPKENLITISNPWYSDKTLTMTWEEFETYAYGFYAYNIKESV